MQVELAHELECSTGLSNVSFTLDHKDQRLRVGRRWTLPALGRGAWVSSANPVAIIRH